MSPLKKGSGKLLPGNMVSPLKKGTGKLLPPFTARWGLQPRAHKQKELWELVVGRVAKSEFNRLILNWFVNWFELIYTLICRLICILIFAFKNLLILNWFQNHFFQYFRLIWIDFFSKSLDWLGSIFDAQGNGSFCVPMWLQPFCRETINPANFGANSLEMPALSWTPSPSPWCAS